MCHQIGFNTGYQLNKVELHFVDEVVQVLYVSCNVVISVIEFVSASTGS